MKHQATRELFAYWNGLRGERTAPQRSEIDPAAIRNVLADTFMLDVDVARRFPVRLAGTRVNGLFDADQKGQSFLSLWRAEERRNVAAVLLTVADGACPVVAGAVAAPRGQDECALELLFLPLRHYGKTHSRILGMVKTATTPDWIGLLPVGPLTLRSLRIVETDELEAGRRPAKVAVNQSFFGASEMPNAISQGDYIPPTGSLITSAKPVQRPPYLRVIQGGL